MRSWPVVIAVLLAACQAGAPIGAMCERNDACSSPLVCRFGRCRNECAAQRDCPVGTTCLLDANGTGSCALTDDPDCSAVGGSCPAPLTCVGRTCLNVCMLGPECPPGSECVPVGGGDPRARCVRTEGVDAGIGAADAGPLDAGRGDGGAGCVLPGCEQPMHLTMGDAWSCVTTDAGHVWCWGYGPSSGRNDVTDGCLMASDGLVACSIPAAMVAEDAAGTVGLATGVTAIDSQDIGGCYLSGRQVYCWGTHIDESALGRTDVTDGHRARLVAFEGGDTLGSIDHLAVFEGSAIAIDATGTWYGWGIDRGDELQLGMPTRTDIPQMLAAPIVSTPTFATGTEHACAIIGGEVLCWGANESGQVDPMHPSATVTLPPTTVMGVSGATQLMLGRTHSCALTSAGLRCWGASENLWLDTAIGPCLDSHTTPGNICTPVTVPTGGLSIGTLQIARNGDDMCIIDTNGILFCRGGGYAAGGTRWWRVPGLPPVESAMIEWTHACAITQAHEVWCWGRNDEGELGHLPLGPAGDPAPVDWTMSR